jgi:DNA primase
MTGRFTQQHIDRARTRRKLSDIVGRDATIKKHGSEWMGLCPFHKERTPSFTVVDAKGFYHCFGCGAHGDAIAWRMQIHGESFAEAIEMLTGEAAPERTQHAQQQRREDDARAAQRHGTLAREIWFAARAIAGTPGEGYFRGRGLTLPLPPSLRYEPRCLHGPKRHGVYLPAVICGVQDLAGHVIAVHRIYLDPATLAAVPRKTARFPDKALLGHPGAGAIRLAPAAETTARCEGVETGLSVQQATGLAVWSAIHGGHMAKMALPPIVKTAVTLADRDKVCWQRGPLYGKRPGEHYARLAAAKDRAEGRASRIAVPPGDKADFNDLLVEEPETTR